MSNGRESTCLVSGVIGNLKSMWTSTAFFRTQQQEMVEAAESGVSSPFPRHAASRHRHAA